MQHIDIEKKRAARWPWMAGLGVLLLAAWGATILLRPPAEEEPPAVAATAADTMDPARIPSPQPTDFGTGVRFDRGLAALMPFGEDDIGQTVNVTGEIVATGNDSFWIVSDSLVLRVDSPRRARRGDTIAVTGILRSADDETTERITAQVLSRHPGSDGWTVIRPFKLVEEDQGDERMSDAG